MSSNRINAVDDHRSVAKPDIDVPDWVKLTELAIINWTRPRPTQPLAPPVRKDVLTLKVELDGLEQAKAEVEALHARWSEVLAMRDAARLEPRE